jgi:hypothetical protein
MREHSLHARNAAVWRPDPRPTIGGASSAAQRSSAVQFSAVQCSAVQRSAVQFSAVQRGHERQRTGDTRASAAARPRHSVGWMRCSVCWTLTASVGSSECTASTAPIMRASAIAAALSTRNSVQWPSQWTSCTACHEYQTLHRSRTTRPAEPVPLPRRAARSGVSRALPSETCLSRCCSDDSGATCRLTVFSVRADGEVRKPNFYTKQRHKGSNRDCRHVECCPPEQLRCGLAGG